MNAAALLPLQSEVAKPQPVEREQALSPTVPVDAPKAVPAETVNLFALPAGIVSFLPSRGTEFKPIALHHDGSLTQESKLVGKIIGDTLVLVGGAPIATLHPDGTIAFSSSTTTYRYQYDGALEGTDGSCVTIDAEGDVHWLESKRDGLPRHIGRFDGLTRQTYRTAAFLILVQRHFSPAKSSSEVSDRTHHVTTSSVSL